jgi:hypothetical protein
MIGKPFAIAPGAPGEAIHLPGFTQQASGTPFLWAVPLVMGHWLPSETAYSKIPRRWSNSK